MKPNPTPAARLLLVDADWAEQRLDNFLVRELKGVPKSHIYRLIRSGQVRLNKGRAKAETKLQAGDVIRIPPVRVAEKEDNTEQVNAHLQKTAALDVLHEEAGFLAVNKAAGMAVHGGSGVSLGLIETLRAQRPAAPYLELVHRLDRDTSGLLLVAKKRSSLVALQAQLKDRSAGKTYLALVQGHWPAKLKVIDQSLRKFQLATGSQAEERRVEVVAHTHPAAMRAISLVQILHSFELALPWGDALPVSLLAVTIKTGRTHQIRVHLASNGHPILGDDKYGDFALNKQLAKGGRQALLPRMFLHAWQLQVQHPQSGQPLHLRCPPPPELAQILPLQLQAELEKNPSRAG